MALAPGLAEAKRTARAELLSRPVPRGAAAVAAGNMAARHLLGLPELQAARHVALFAALPDEPPTRTVFEGIRSRGRLPLLPRVAGGEGLVFLPAPSWEALRPGRLGILEPLDLGTPVVLGPTDLVIVPGLGFDRRGHRLGRGAGHYDRAFGTGAPGPFLVGYAWACRVGGEIPAGPLDRRVDAVVTELGAIRAAGGTDEGHGPG